MSASQAMRLSAFFVVLTTLLNATSIQADQLPYYYGLDVGYSTFDQAGGGDPTVGIYLGQYLNDNILIEAGYASLGEGGFIRFRDETLGPSPSVSTLYGGGVVNFYAPAQTGISGFLSAGVSNWYYKLGAERDGGVDLYYGLGGQYAIDRSILIRLSVKIYIVNPTISGEELDDEIMVTSLGLKYRP